MSISSKTWRVYRTTRAAALVAAAFLGACAGPVARPDDPRALRQVAPQRLALEQRQALEKELKAAPRGPRAASLQDALARDRAGEGDWADAGKRWQQLAKEHAQDAWGVLARWRIAQSLEKVGDPARALIQWQGLMDLDPVLEGDSVAEGKKRALALIPSLDLTQTAEILAMAPHPEILGELRFQRLSKLVEAGQAQTALDACEEYLRLHPGEAHRGEVEAMLVKAEDQLPVAERSVGVLLPMSGRLAPFAEQVRRGLTLAVAEANQGLALEKQFVIVEADEGTNTQTAEAGARLLIDDKKVIGVLGPLGSDSVAALAPLLNARRVPMLSSTASRPELTKLSSWFMRSALGPDRLAVAMADHALLDMRLSRVALLRPDTPYGATMAASFVSRVAELGAVVAAQVSFTPGTRDWNDTMRALGGVDPSDAKTADFNEKRDQQSNVEAISTDFGRLLLALTRTADLSGTAQVLSGSTATLALTGTVRPRLARPVTSAAQTNPAEAVPFAPLRVVIIDMACDTSTAELNAGRAFADRFHRVLGQLEEINVVDPSVATRWMEERSLTSNSLGLSRAAELGRDLNADYVVWGQAREIYADMPYLTTTARESSPEGRQARKDLTLFEANRVFELGAILLDARSATVAARGQFQFSKYKTPEPNPLGLQAIFIPSTADDAALLAPTLRFFELRMQLLGGDLWDDSATLRRVPELEGVRFATAFHADGKDTATARFVAAYRARYAERPNVFAAQAYDAAHLMLRALGEGARSRRQLRESLLRFGSSRGAAGWTGFDGRQDATRRPLILRVDHGETDELN